MDKHMRKEGKRMYEMIHIPPDPKIRKEYHSHRERKAAMRRLAILVAVAVFLGILAAVISVWSEPREASAAEVETIEPITVAHIVLETEAVAPTVPTIAPEPESDPESVIPVDVEAAEYMGEFTLTAYCACKKCCGEDAKGITRSGTHVTEGRTIAVDPKVIPLGTKVYIEDYGFYVAEDTGGLIKGNAIDIYYPSHEIALNFAGGEGHCEKRVWIIDES